MPQHIKLILEYDGTEFAGWQVQPNERTVQGDLEKALRQFYQEDITVTAAGRTDAGVHARGQVVNFSAGKSRPLQSIEDGLNSILADTISIGSAEEIPKGFNARFDAVRRIYRYQIVGRKHSLQQRFAWCLTDVLKLSDMQICARMAVGEHDFRSFCSAKAEVDHHLCRVESANWLCQGTRPALLVFRIAANRFLHNMVRILVGTMVEVGRGRFTTADFAKMLASRNRESAGRTAPAKGLCLERVDYG